MRTPIYIKSIELNNVRTFGDKVFLNLQKENNIIPQWTLILGDNSIGKSTLLQCIAWMKPLLPYDLKITPGFKPSPIINDEENETLARLVRKNKKLCSLHAVFVAHKKLNKELPPNEEMICKTNMSITLDNKKKLLKVNPGFKTTRPDRKLFYSQEILIFAYSASRSLGKLNLNDPDLLETIPGFIKEKTELYDAEEILHTIHYASLGSLNSLEKRRYTALINDIKEMLVRILPDFKVIKDIEISPPKLLDGKNEGGIMITTRHGEKIPFGDFSLGYKTVTSWTIDLAWRLFNKYQKSRDPLKEPAIVLIDEIDLHLHPVWQREIMKNLSKHFPNVQFIASAHSPLMVQAATNANYAVLQFINGGVVIENNPEGIDGWRVDQILTSEFFGLKSSRGEDYEKLFDRRQHLVNRSRLTKKENIELKRITKRLYELPAGETKEEMDNRKFISDIVSKIKQKK
jgi:predicted ATP-binding protein involved in virulence